MPPAAAPAPPTEAGIPPPPPGYTLDKPWLNDPPVASGAVPPPPPGYTLDKPNADRPWLNDPPVASTAGHIPPPPPGYTLDKPNADRPWLNDPPVSQDTSYGSAVQEGLHDAGAGLGATAEVAGQDLAAAGLPGVGKAVSGAGKWASNLVPAPANYSSAGGDMAAKLKAGKLLGALADLPRAAVEGAPAVAGGLAGAALGTAALPEAALGVGGAALGAGAYAALSSFGQDAQARAAANGHASPTANDQLIAGATAAGQGALGAVGLGKTPGISAMLVKSPAYLEALAKGTTDAAGSAASNVVGQIGTTAGTTQGLTVDPAQAAAAALQAGAARGLPLLGKQAAGAVGDTAGAAGQAMKQGLANYGTNAVLKGLPPMSDEQAASVVRINNALEAQVPANPKASGTQLANGLWKSTKASMQDTIDGAIKSGQVDADTGAMLQTAMQQAAVHKSALDTNLLTKLNNPSVDPQLATTLRNGLTDLDGMSQMVNYKQASGPFAAIGAKLASIGTIGGAVLAGLHGDVSPMTDVGLTALAGGSHATGITGAVGNAVGGWLDRKLGTSQPLPVLQKAAALKQVQAAGLDADADALSPLQATSDTLRQAQATQAQATADAAAKAKAANLQEAAANTVSGMAYRNSPEGIIARANMATRKKDLLTQAAADGRLQQPMSQDELDRVSIGLSPRDPIPANVPLNGDQPIGQPAPVGPQAPRPGIQPVQPMGVPAAPVGAPASSLPEGWLSHLKTQLVANGLAPTNDTIGRALGAAVSNGRITQDLADHLLAHPGTFLGDKTIPFQHLVNTARENNGMTPNPIVAPVQSQPKYAAAVQTYQRLGDTLQAQAQADNDLPLMVSIARIMSTSSSQQKADIANQELAQRSHDAAALARAKQLLPPELLKGR